MRGRRVQSTRGAGLRPTSERVRAAIFSILGPGAVNGLRVLDLYAGAGTFGIEALSRGASWCDFVELNPRRSQDIRESLRELGVASQGHVYSGVVEKTLDAVRGAYDLVFADPPYGLDPWKWLMDRLGSGDLLNENAYVVVEHHYKSELLENYGKLAQETVRRYGDTTVRVYAAGGDDA